MTRDDVKDAILQLTVTEHYYTGVQDLVTLLCQFNDVSVKVRYGLAWASRKWRMFPICRVGPAHVS